MTVEKTPDESTNHRRLPDWLGDTLRFRILQGEIYPSIRAISAGLSDKREITVTYHLDRTPHDEDQESIDCFTTVVAADIWNHPDFVDIFSECVLWEGDLRTLIYSGEIIYMRQERLPSPDMTKYK